MAVLVFAGAARAQFIATGTGPYDYNDPDPAKWTGGAINGQFTQTLAADQTITFGTYTVLNSGLQFNLGGTNKLTLRSNGSGAQTITLQNNLSLSGTADVVIGSAIAGKELSINLDVSPRSFTVAAGRTLTVLNGITGSTGAAMNKYGAGTMVFAGSASYMDSTTVWEGTLQFAMALPREALTAV